MTDLAGVSGKDAVKAFMKVGYVVIRQRGSHVRMKSDERSTFPLTIPLHKELKIRLLRQLIQDAGLVNETFLDLLK